MLACTGPPCPTAMTWASPHGLRSGSACAAKRCCRLRASRRRGLPRHASVARPPCCGRSTLLRTWSAGSALAAPLRARSGPLRWDRSPPRPRHRRSPRPSPPSRKPSSSMLMPCLRRSPSSLAPTLRCTSRFCLMLRVCSQLLRAVHSAGIRSSGSGGSAPLRPCSRARFCPWRSSLRRLLMSGGRLGHLCSSLLHCFASVSGQGNAMRRSPHSRMSCGRPRPIGRDTTSPPLCRKRCSPCS